jgi:hypothetical protein
MKGMACRNIDALYKNGHEFGTVLRAICKGSKEEK